MAGLNNSFETGSIPPGLGQPAPAPTPQVALPGPAPPLGLGLARLTIVVAGDVVVTTQFGNVNIVKR